MGQAQWGSGPRSATVDARGILTATARAYPKSVVQQVVLEATGRQPVSLFNCCHALQNVTQVWIAA